MKIFKHLLIGIIFILSTSVQAGIYSDDLSRCLIELSTKQDKITLVKWMFTAMSLHPAVQSMSKVNKKQREMSNKNMAELMVELISVKCIKQAKKAIKYEGDTALVSSFRLFGRIAGKELFANPKVAKSLSDINKYLDSETLNKRLGIKK